MTPDVFAQSVLFTLGPFPVTGMMVASVFTSLVLCVLGGLLARAVRHAHRWLFADGFPDVARQHELG